MKNTLLIALIAFVVSGCGQSVDTAPPASSMNPKATAVAPTPTPTTPEGKIEAIQKSDMNPEQKKRAIEQVKSGQL